MDEDDQIKFDETMAQGRTMFLGFAYFGGVSFLGIGVELLCTDGVGWVVAGALMLLPPMLYKFTKR